MKLCSSIQIALVAGTLLLPISAPVLAQTVTNQPALASGELSSSDHSSDKGSVTIPRSTPEEMQKAKDGTTASASGETGLLSYKKLGILGVLFCSFAIGCAGGLCYYMGVYFGFIDRRERDSILQYMTTGQAFWLFCALGGIVALVFQTAQIDTLVPIQAFVLGATWPSVVNRMISGNSSGPGKLTDIINSKDAASVPLPAGTDPNAKPRSIPL
jgi:uncharacterized membrane protein